MESTAEDTSEGTMNTIKSNFLKSRNSNDSERTVQPAKEDTLSYSASLMSPKDMMNLRK
jgi:hypothetical protein